MHPTLHNEIARQRAGDMLREAERERLAALAVGDDSAPEMGRVKALASRVSFGRLKRLGRREVAVHPAA